MSRLRISLTAAFALVLAMTLAGCIGSSVEADSPSDERTDTRPARMPDLVGSRLGHAVEVLAGHPASSTASFPATTAAIGLAARHIAGVTKPPRDVKIEIPERVRKLDDLTETDDHRVTAQTPAAGSVLETTTEIRLVVGPHPGQKDEPWVLSGHTKAIRAEGADPCFECHRPQACTPCHMQYLE